MPTSPARADKSAPTNTASATAVATTTARVRSAAGPESRRPEDRAKESGDVAQGANKQKKVAQKAVPTETQIAPVTSASVVAGVRAALVAEVDAAAPQEMVEGGEDLPEAFRPVAEESPVATPQTAVRVRPVKPGELAELRRVLATQGCGGRGLGSSGPEQRAPSRGRVGKPKGASRTRRGPKKTAHQRRFAATRASGHHPLLNPWDLLPLDVRSSVAGQERAIYRARGSLVCHWDFPMYRMLSTHNVSLAPTVFPVAPVWWPVEWGHLPITLPWELSVYRTDLVRADYSDPLWQEVHQKFLEQFAGGWDLLYSQVGDPNQLEALPADLARAIVDVGGFSFCSGLASSASFKKFLELHSLNEEDIPDQRIAKRTAWERITALKKEREATKQQQVVPRTICSCKERLSRAVRRLGVEAQILEAVQDEAPSNILSDAANLAALTSALLTHSLDTERIVTRVGNLLRREERNFQGRRSEEALSLLNSSTTLADFLPARYESNIDRIGVPRSQYVGRN